MKRCHMLTLILGAGLLVAAPRPAAAYWDDVHYHLTYFVARLVGYTPQQAYRIAAANLSTDYHPATEPGQITEAEIRGNRVPDPQPAEKQNPRWWFHAFRNQTDPRFKDAIGNGTGAAEADAAIVAQRNRLFRHGVTIRNPGVFLHFLQDEDPHVGFGSAWGHWFNPLNPGPTSALARQAGLPVGGSVDWLDFDRDPTQAPAAKSTALDMVRETQLWLERFMAEVSPRQKRREFSLVETESLVDGLLGLGPAPRPMTASDVDDYVLYRSLPAVLTGLTAQQNENFRRHAEGPNLATAETLLNAALQKMGMVEKTIPPYKPAQQQYKFKVTGDSSVFPIDDKGELSQQAVDDWVLTGSLKLTVDADPGAPREPVEVRLKAPSTMTGQPEYDLTEKPLALNIGAPAVLEHMPVGTVLIEVSRNGAGLKSERIEIKAAQTDLTVRLPAPFDWSGQWEVEYQPQPNGPWFRIGVMTWRKATLQEALDLKAKQLGTSADPCLGRPSYAAFIADFPWGPAGFEGGKMAGFACGPDASTLKGRYGHTKHFGSFLGGLKGYIDMTLNADSKSFRGAFIEDFQTGSWLAWRGKRLGP